MPETPEEGSTTPESAPRTREAAQKIFEQGMLMLELPDPKTFGAIARATLDAAKAYDSLPNTERVSKADEVARKRAERIAARSAEGSTSSGS